MIFAIKVTAVSIFKQDKLPCINRSMQVKKLNNNMLSSNNSMLVLDACQVIATPIISQIAN